MHGLYQDLHHFYLQDAVADRKLRENNSWVMTSEDEHGFVKLPHERILYKSPPRTSLEISSKNPFPGSQPFVSKSSGGVAYITNQRIVYLPAKSTPELQSFHSPILNLQDSHVQTPWFGSNSWIASCRPVPDGGIPSQHQLVELKLTFQEGGSFDFDSIFVQIKERLYQAHTIARENGHRGNVDVDLEQLPAYEPAREVETGNNDGPALISPVPVRPPQRHGSIAGAQPPNTAAHPPPAIGPDELPPGYEETQADLLYQRLREEARRQ